MVSRRSRAAAPDNRLAIAVAERRAGGRPYLDLTVSNPTAAGIPYETEEILRALSSRSSLRYEPHPFGLESARAIVSELWRSRGVDVPKERVALTASTSEAYAFLFKVLADPGDSILVPEPSYPLFEHLARYEGLVTVPYPVVYDGAWHVDVAALRARVTSGVRAVVAVSPNNPTGSFLKDDELAVIADLGLPIIADEVFGEYAFGDDPRRVRSALAAGDRALVFALDGLSKLAALPQMKLAWITAAGPRPLVEEALASLELVLDTFLSPGAPVQHALPALLAAGKSSRDSILVRARANLAELARRALGSAATLLSVEGGWYGVLRLPMVRAEEDWTLVLLDEDDVFVQPGYFYDFAEEPYLVLSLLTEEAAFREGVDRIVRRVDESSNSSAPRFRSAPQT